MKLLVVVWVLAWVLVWVLALVTAILPADMVSKLLHLHSQGKTLWQWQHTRLAECWC